MDVKEEYRAEWRYHFPGWTLDNLETFFVRDCPTDRTLKLVHQAHPVVMLLHENRFDLAYDVLDCPRADGLWIELDHDIVRIACCAIRDMLKN